MTRERESAIDVHLPELASLLDRWRIPTVAIATKGVPPHITLLYPWRPAPVQSSDIAEAEAAVAGISPFVITLRQLGRFPGVLYLCPEPDNSLRVLIKRLMAAFPDTPLYEGQFPEPVPHLTVAKAVTEDELDRIEAKVSAALAPHLPLTLTIRNLAIEEEGSDGMWSVRTTIALKGDTRAP
jgi:2'-5' RNA ligase